MPVISGLSDATKLSLVEYCYRKRIGQIAWVEKHLDEDLEQERKEEAYGTLKNLAEPFKMAEERGRR